MCASPSCPRDSALSAHEDRARNPSAKRQPTALLVFYFSAPFFAWFLFRFFIVPLGG